MKSTVLLLVATILAICLAGCGPTAPTLQTLPELQAAAKALSQAEADGAATLCPTEYQAAKDKLRQAELLFQDGQVDAARAAAEQAIDLANLARGCAIAHNQPAPPPPAPATKPELRLAQDFLDMKHSVFFDFNSNVLTAEERARLDPIVERIGKMAQNHKFFVVLVAFCDGPGTTEVNQALAMRRAQVVRYYLTRPGTGIDRDRILIVAMGNGPATNEGESNAQNREWRRVVIAISTGVPQEAVPQQEGGEQPPE